MSREPAAAAASAGDAAPVNAGGKNLGLSSEIVAILRCPLCAQPLARDRAALRCGAGHAFDIARQGYVNLASGRRPPRNADTKEMVAARAGFLGQGHYAPLAEALAAHLREHAPTQSEVGRIVDIGAGTGYYLARALDACESARGLAVDISKFAARHAVRAHARAGAVVADASARIPVADGAASALLSVFAPRKADELARVLARDGVLLVVSAGAEHLAELRAALGLMAVEADKEARLRAQLGGHFELRSSAELRLELDLGAAQIAALVGMGPNAFHLGGAALAERLANVADATRVSAVFRVDVLAKRAG
ncbi:putative RNA methyltransferase [Haliangium ochraceum]|uniref:rRNA (Guanine-N(1)-)-methyltransferase n=1 Tax=Haliangium ochraceum (strain DSM 14365 / JCM 11303 / SMP-2) TaxID=502025 RepID=D0LFS4_HALO1|nr:methyltransferase domain-containing protein [Haliangium ochraceum]ACY14526.1 rRNA (guanine-N(1)-)-methyltransferase [Haliangium ochraceum DSM 14365]